jgi:hybrid cluster-associated redox disulfide protein
VPFCYLRWRKDKVSSEEYPGGMNTTIIDLQWTVDKVLQKWPGAFSVFMKHKTKCPGCFMQSFCTLKDVADTYQLSLEKLIDEIKNASD